MHYGAYAFSKNGEITIESKVSVTLYSRLFMVIKREVCANNKTQSEMF
jgi:hypothetical protein